MNRVGVVLFLVAAACGEPKKAAWDLSQPVPPGEARAGRTAKEADLVQGPKSTARVGDFKIYNGKVRFIVEDARPSSGYGPYGGTIAAADRVRAEGGDQSLFGELIHGLGMRAIRADKVELVRDGVGGGAAHLRVTGGDDGIPILEAALGNGVDPAFPALDLQVVVDYVLEPDAEALKVTASFKTRSGEALDLGSAQLAILMGDGLYRYHDAQGFTDPVRPGETPFSAAVGDEVSYGFFPVGRTLVMAISYQGIALADLGSVTLGAGQEGRQIFYVAVGDGDVASLLRILDGIRPLGRTRVAGRVVDPAGAPVARARVHLTHPDGTYLAFARTRDDGTFDALLPAGPAVVQAVVPGRPPMTPLSVDVPKAGLSALTLALEDFSALKVRVLEKGAPIPAKLVLWREAGVSPSYPRTYGEPGQPAGAAALRYLPPGEETVPLIAGRYRAVAMRGLEYDLVERTVTVAPGEMLPLSFDLTRVLDTTGYLSGDFHIHAAPSADSDDLVTFKSLAFAGENLEIAVTSDHDVIFDYQPTIDALGLGRFVRNFPGEEVSTTTYGHFNIFPCAVLDEPNGGAVAWHFQGAPALFAKMRANPAAPLLQVNHPRSSVGAGYFASIGLDRDRFVATLKPASDFLTSFDAIEVLNGKRYDATEAQVMPDWFAFLNRGYRVTGNGNSDSHNAKSSEVGIPRNYVEVGVDEPDRVDPAAFVAAVKAGRVSVSAGPFLKFSINGAGLGRMATLDQGAAKLSIAMSAPAWMGPIETIEVIKNGQVFQTVAVTAADADPNNPVVRYRGTLVDRPAADAWYLLRARSAGGNLGPLNSARPYAFTNPIYVDADGSAAFDPPIR